MLDNTAAVTLLIFNSFQSARVGVAALQHVRARGQRVEEGMLDEEIGCPAGITAILNAERSCWGLPVRNRIEQAGKYFSVWTSLGAQEGQEPHCRYFLLPVCE